MTIWNYKKNEKTKGVYQMINNVTLTGRLVAVPELRETPSGNKVVSIVVAVDRPRKNAEGNRDADFIPVTAWGKSAEFVCNNFTKGDFIAITGSVRTRIRQNSDDKSFRQVEVNAENVSFCGYKRAQ